MPPPIDSKQMVDNIGESIRTYLERASEEERHKCLAQLLDWCAEREREGQATPASRVASGAPAPTTHNLPEASTPSGGRAAGHANTHPPAGPQTDTSDASSTLRHGRPASQQSPSTVTPQESEATCYKPIARITPKGGRRRHRPANPTFISSCCHLDMSRREAHQHGGAAT